MSAAMVWETSLNWAAGAPPSARQCAVPLESSCRTLSLVPSQESFSPSRLTSGEFRGLKKPNSFSSLKAQLGSSRADRSVPQLVAPEARAGRRASKSSQHSRPKGKARRDQLQNPNSRRNRFPSLEASAAAEELAFAGGEGGGGKAGTSGGGGGGGGEGGDGSGEDGGKNKAEALAALAALGRTVETLPLDLRGAVLEGRIPGAIVERFVQMEGNSVFRWLLGFGGFKERLLADDLFLTKVAIEVGVGVFTKTAAELERRRENFWKEIDFVIADIFMAIVADFMLVWLPAPTVALRPRLATSAGALTQFFYNCPDNAFQVAMAGTSYTVLQRGASIVRNGAKLLAVGTTASLFGTGATNGIILLRKALDSSYVGTSEGSGEAEVPILATSVAYGAYMAVSSNIRYQILAGVVEQRVLEPALHNQKLALSVLSFVCRTGNTFLGSLMWVDYARWVGIQ